MLTPAQDIPHLTGLRAVAALMVLLLHLDQIHGNVLSHYFAPVSHGFLGVDIFFVLSGYILSHVYLKMFSRISIRDYGLFLWRRLARIYPVHIAVLAALFVMVAVRGLLNTNFWIVADLPRQIALMQAWTDTLTWNVPAWSISAEWAAYVFFPLFAVMFLRRAPLWPGVALMGGLLAAFQLTYLNKHGLASAFMGWPAFLRVMSEFSIGVLGYRISRSFEPSWKFDVVASLSFVAIFIAPLPLAKLLAVSVFIPAVATSQTFVRRALSSSPAVALGVVSYSVYMTHFPLLKLIQNFNYRFGLEETSTLVAPMLTISWAVVAILLATATYWVIEKPARDWCRRSEQGLFARRLRGADPLT